MTSELDKPNWAVINGDDNVVERTSTHTSSSRTQLHSVCSMPKAAKSSPSEFTHFWRLRCRLPERHGQACRVLVRSKSRAIRNILIEFEDGVRYVVGWRSIRRLSVRRDVRDG